MIMCANAKLDNFYKRVYEAVKKIPVGKVATYGYIAAAAGSFKAARIVGRALHLNPDPMTIPCHRVVNRFGGLAPDFVFGGIEEQAARLKKEGVEVADGKVDLARYGLNRF